MRSTEPGRAADARSDPAVPVDHPDPGRAGGKPGELPNIDEVAGIAENAVIVTTGDQFHHGIGYGTPPDEALDPEPDGLAAARASSTTRSAGTSVLVM